MLIPSCSRQSAEPLLLDIERLPCFATGIPAAAIINAAVVEILNVPVPSPPVPTISSTSRLGLMWSAFSLITCALAVISSIVSPLILKAVRYAAICDCVAVPENISSITCAASSKVRSLPATNFFIASFIIKLQSFPCYLQSVIKFFIISIPCEVRIDSGWNCNP